MKKLFFMTFSALLIFLLAGLSVSALTKDEDGCLVFESTDNRNILASVDHSYDEAIAEVLLHGEVSPDHLTSALSSDSQAKVLYAEYTNPEIIGVRDVIVSYLYGSGTVTKVEAVYTDDWAEARLIFDQRLSEVKEELMALIPEGATDFQKAHIVHDYLASTTSYDKKSLVDGTDNRYLYDAYGALVNHSAVCQGYSLAYKLIMDWLDIDCMLVSSARKDHAWNLVKLGEGDSADWYHVDISADDPYYDMLGQVGHGYLFLSTEELLAKDADRSDFIVYASDFTLNFTDETCGTTSYDSTEHSEAAVFRSANTCCVYYENTQGTLDLYTVNMDTEVLCRNGEVFWQPENEAMHWYPYAGGSFTNLSGFSRLCGQDGILYQSSLNKIFRIDVTGETPSAEVYFTAPASETYEKIFGMARVEGTLYYCYEPVNPSYSSPEIWTPVPETAEPAEADPEGPADYTLYLSGGKSYRDPGHTEEVTVPGLSFDAQGGFWLLNNVNFVSSGEFAAVAEGDTVLMLSENSVNVIALSGSPMVFGGALYCTGSLTVSGEGSLSLSAAGDARRVYGLTVLGDLRVKSGAKLNAVGNNSGSSGIGFGIFQWKNGGRTLLTDCTVTAMGQRAAALFSETVVTKQYGNADMTVTGSTDYGAESLSAAVIGHMPVSSSESEEVCTVKISDNAVKTLKLCSSSLTLLAETVDASGNRIASYYTLEDALLYASEGQTVRPLSDSVLTWTVQVPEGKTAVLDLNGYTLSDPGLYKSFGSLFLNLGTLSITDSSEAGTGCISGHPFVGLIDNQGTLKLKGGTLKGYYCEVENSEKALFIMDGGMITPSTYVSSNVAVQNYGSFTMNGGQIYDNAKAVKNYEGASFTLTGGTISKNYDSAFEGVVQNYGSFVMSGGSITDNTGAVFTKSSSTFLTGGSITSNKGKGVYCYSGCGTVTLGGDITISGNTGANLYLLSGAEATRILVSAGTPLTEQAAVGLSFSDTSSGTGVLKSLPYVLVSSGLSASCAEVFTLDTAISGARLLYTGGGLVLSDSSRVFVLLFSDCEGESAALLSGGGAYPSGSSVTVTAKAEEGFLFLGWYDGSSCLGTEESLTLSSVNSDLSLTAKYEAPADTAVTLDLQPGLYEVRLPGESSFRSCSVWRVESIACWSEVTLRYTGSGSFDHWEDGNGNVLGRSRSLTFRPARGMTVKAVESSGT